MSDLDKHYNLDKLTGEINDYIEDSVDLSNMEDYEALLTKKISNKITKTRIVVPIQNDLKVEIEKIKAIFDEPVAGNYMDYNISTSLGYSVYPTTAQTSNKLIEMAIDAIKTAMCYKQN